MEEKDRYEKQGGMIQAGRGSVPASEILCEDCDGVNGGRGEHDQVSLKKAVSFMRRERIAEIVRRKGGGVTQDVLPRRMPSRIVVVDQLAKSMESKEPAASEGKEEEVIMRRGRVGKGKARQMLNREAEFARGGSAKLAEAALQRLSDNRALASGPDVREQMFQLAANAREISGMARFSLTYPSASHDDLLFLALACCGFFALH